MGVQRVEKIIGKSYQQRDIKLYEFLVDKPKFNVLITGTEHGIEFKGGESVDRLMDDIEDTTFYDDVNIVAVPYWNVDGVANNTYGNAQNLQIGYSILNAATYEMRAIWEYLFDTPYFPDLYINNHNLDRYNRGSSFYLYDHVPRLALHEDLVIGIDTTSMHRHKITWNQWTEMVKHVQDNSSGYVFSKFWELDDNLNLIYNVGYDVGYWNSWLSARLDTLTFLIEGVTPEDYTNPDDPGWEPTVQAQFLGNKYMIDWARKKHPELVESKCAPPYVSEVMPIRESLIPEMFPDKVTVENDATGSATSLWSISTKRGYSQTEQYYNNRSSLEWITAPLAYAIHKTNEDDLTLYTKYWGFDWVDGQTTDTYDCEVFHCTHADPWWDAEGVITNQWIQANVEGYYVSSTRTNFSQYTIFPVEQYGGDALVQVLEPISKGNISRHQGLFPTLSLKANNDYPILRLIRKR